MSPGRRHLQLLRRAAAALAGAVAVVVLVAAISWILLRVLRPTLFPAQPSAPSQLGHFLERAFLHFDFDRSNAGSQRPVSALMREGLPVDAVLLGGGLLAGLAMGVAGGLVCASRRRSVRTRVIETLAAAAISTPVYVVGLFALLLFGAEIGDIDVGVGIPVEYVSPGDGIGRWLGSLIVPWLILGLPLAGLLVRAMSSAADATLREDFVGAALARGVGRRRILTRHVAPVAALPALGIASASGNIMLLNMVLVERVFSVPGFMREVAGSVRDADVPVLLALSTAGAAFVVLTSIVFGALTDAMDPRVRHAAIQEP
ncbi:MAG: ABC transporter permease subunit [Solirubrobacteraceae bacterium]